jgi:WD40 repeat protein
MAFWLTRLVAIVSLAGCLSVSLSAASVPEWKSRLTISLPGEATVISYSPDGNLIAVGHANGQVTIWETKNGSLVRSLTAHPAKIKTLLFTTQGDRLITLGDEDRARVWTVSSWAEAGSIEDIAFSIAVSRDALWLAGQDSKQALWLWDMTTFKRSKQLTKPGGGGARDLLFTADGRHLLLIYGNDPHLIDVTTVNDSLLPVRTAKPQINLKQTGNDQFSISLGALNDDSAMSHNLALSSNSALIAIGRGWYGKPAFVDVLDMDKKERVKRFKPKDGGFAASFSFDNSLIAIEGAQNVTVWGLVDGKQRAVVKGDGLVQFSPKSMELAVTNGNSLIVYTSN